MSIRRAVELNFQTRLDRAFKGSRYKVVGGTSADDRPSPCIIVVAGEADSALPEMSDSLDNYICDLSVVILSGVDEDGFNQHNDANGIVSSVFSNRETRKESMVEKLYIYDVVKLGVSEDNIPDQRKFGTAYNFKVVFNYSG
jgi:hypothetical protein